MIFIPTCSDDGTTDLLLPHLQKEAEVFRFDIDKFRDYRWDVSTFGVSMSDATGRSISDRSLSCFYLRKPTFFEDLDIPKEGLLENWCRQEVSDWLHDLYAQCAAAGLCALVHPGHGAWRKPRQMRVATKYFAVPEWHLVQGAIPDLPKNKRWAVKTLTQTKIGQNRYLFVREADPMKLDLSYPWFLQEVIDGGNDETVAYVDGRIFAYACGRKDGDHLDSRRNYMEGRPEWKPVKYSPEEEASIQGFMAETGLSFGRFDFIRREGVLYFLELNPNGQWAWLDERDETGLVSAVAEAILAIERRGQTLGPQPLAAPPLPLPGA